jgi:hypothetical protein
MRVRTCCLDILCDAPIKTHAGKVRGFVGNRFKNRILLHNHIGPDKQGYLYPRIQYRTYNGMIKIIAIEEGVEEIEFLKENLDHLDLDGKKYHIIKKKTDYKEKNFGIRNSRCVYKLIDPWLALNSNNYKQFKDLPENRRRKKLSSILIGNIISLSKSLAYNVSDDLSVVTDFYQTNRAVYMNGNRMIAFLGMFTINFQMPDFWGIGKSVSKGFGTIIRLHS